MYINPFIAGILTVIVVEVLFIFVWGITHGRRVHTMEYTITPEEMEEIREICRLAEEEYTRRKKNESTNNN